MRIGIAGPIATENISHLLDGASSSLPIGYPGAPFFSTLIEALLLRGHELTIFTLSRDVSPGAINLPTASGRNIKVYFGPYRYHPFRPNGTLPGRIVDFFRLERKKLSRAMREASVDIVHAHWTYEFAMGAMESKLPCVVTCHDSPWRVMTLMRTPYRVGRYFMARYVLRKAKYLTAVSPYLQAELQKYTPTAIQMVPTPVPEQVLRMAPAEPRIFNPAAPRIAMVLNGWGPLKNPKLGLAAFGVLRAQIPSAELHVFGDGYAADGPAATWAQCEGLASGVVFHGAVSHKELVNSLLSMHILLHPSLEEAGSMVLAESTSLGLPVVGGERSGGVPWSLDYGSCGLLTDVKSAEAICAALHQLINDRNLYLRLARRGLIRGHQDFSADGVAAQYESIYEAAVYGRPVRVGLK